MLLVLLLASSSWVVGLAPRMLPADHRLAVAGPLAADDNFTRSYTAATELTILANDQPGTAALNPASVLLLGSSSSGTTDVAGQGATFSVDATGLVRARPAPFSGSQTTARIRYTVQDQTGAASAPATLTLTLTNAAPLARADAATTPTNTPVTVAVTSNDTDADGAATIRAATVQISSPIGTNGGGTFRVEATGSVTFTPAGGFTGTSSTTYTVQDELGRVSGAAQITITVSNAAPVAVRDVAATLTGTAVQIPVLQNDTDANGYATLVPGSVTLSPSSGVTTGGRFSVNTTTGVVTFVPAAGSTGATIGYRVRDTQGALSNSANITVIITSLSADVQATLRGPATVPAGAYVELSLTLTNAGTVAATSVQGRVRLPAYLSEVTASHNAVYGTTTGAVVFPAADLPAGTSRVHTVRLLMPARTAVSAVGTSTATSADPAALNNDGTQPAALTTCAPVQVADVAALGTGPATVAGPGRVGYQVQAVNYGPSTATQVALAAQLPANLTGVAVSGGGRYDAATGRVTVPAVAEIAARTATSVSISFDTPPAGTIVAAQVWATSTTAQGDPLPANNDSSGPLASWQTTITGPVASTFCPGPATLTAVTSPGQRLNTYYPGLGTAAGTTLRVGPARAAPDAEAIQAGDLVLVMQMQGADLDYSNSAAYGDGLAYEYLPARGHLWSTCWAGRYEYRYVTGSSVTPGAGGTLLLAAPLTAIYQNSDATTNAGARRYQVIRVPRFRSLTLGADAQPAAWDGRTGGVLALQVEGPFEPAGYRLDARGAGFRGGGGVLLGGPAPAGVSTTDWAMRWGTAVHAAKGEGLAGTPRLLNGAGVLLNTGSEGYPGGSMGRGAPANAGGGGTDGNTRNNQNNTGGGGGANGGFGGQGGNAWFVGNATGGNGGEPFLAAQPGRVVLGGGGGAGSTNNGTGGQGAAVNVNNGFNSSGGAGGGIVLLNLDQLVGTGIIDVSGASVTLPVDNDGGGGGGGGGSVVVMSRGSLTGLTVVANGGRGGDNNLAATGPHGPGGGGSAGVVLASGALAAASQAVPGSNGLTGTSAGPDAFGATPGSQLAPLWRTDVLPEELPQVSSCRLVPLPVTLQYFEAVGCAAAAQLRWATAQEINSARFEVERSVDGHRFTRVSSRPAAGQSTTPRTYTFTDYPPAQPLLYYRLRQVDQDSTFTYSGVRVVQLAAPTGQPRLYPNPAAGTVTLDLTALAPDTYSVGIYNLVGQQQQRRTAAGGQLSSWPLDALLPGVYLLEVTAPGFCWRQRIIRQ
ncbi:Ig-like domain-containing protein [Hymenobacter rigui]|uniref:T9SS C-terminal target domain-containing protein n=1 Tax=Hymenobacter rigui TaxID=334424 RepID=A0A428KRF8_9BACT|nr:Ig-like domain-containing protein [Hymenobacter rigui]RSK49053.1 T9SS C-terminal target domain-containing protein [Hymenobacter rigui]